MNSFSFNPLATILNQNKLLGSNYIDWKRNLYIVPTAVGYKYVLTTECPQDLGPDAPQDEKDLYTKWLKYDEMATCYMMASMLSIFQHQHESFRTTFEIISNLKEMFGDQGVPARQGSHEGYYKH